MEMETDFKKRMLEEKKALAQEKQQLTFESGNFESELLKIKEQLSVKEREVELERKAIEEDKNTLEMINNQAMSKHRANFAEVQAERERLKDMEIEMVKKMRVIDMRSKELSYQCNNHE